MLNNYLEIKPYPEAEFANEYEAFVFCGQNGPFWGRMDF